MSRLETLRKNFSHETVLKFRQELKSGTFKREEIIAAAELIAEQSLRTSSSSIKDLNPDVVIIGDGPHAAISALNLRLENPNLKIQIITNSKNLGGAFANTGEFYRLNAPELKEHSAHNFPNSPFQLLDIVDPGFVMAKYLARTIALNLYAGGEIAMNTMAKSVSFDGSRYKVTTDTGIQLNAKAVIDATGLGNTPVYGISDPTSIRIIKTVEENSRKQAPQLAPLIEHYGRLAERATSLAYQTNSTFIKDYEGKRIAVIGAGGAGSTAIEALIGYGPGNIYGRKQDGILGEKLGPGIGESGGIASLDWWGQSNQSNLDFNSQSNGRFKSTVGLFREYQKLNKIDDYITLISVISVEGVPKVKLTDAKGNSRIYDKVVFATGYEPPNIKWEIEGTSVLHPANKAITGNLSDGRFVKLATTPEPNSSTARSALVGPRAGQIVPPEEFRLSPTLTWTSIDVLSQRTMEAAKRIGKLLKETALHETNIQRIGAAVKSANEYRYESNIIRNHPKFKKLEEQYQFAINYSDGRLTNRLKHSESVGDVAATLAAKLGMSEASQELARNIGLVHDLGHAPFSHWGEVAINKKLKTVNAKWDHDTAGIELLRQSKTQFDNTFFEGIRGRFWKVDGKFNYLEGQLAAQADRISFNSTDIQDGLRIGRIDPKDLKIHFPSAFMVLEHLFYETGLSILKANPGSLDIKKIVLILKADPTLADFVYSQFASAFRDYQMNDLLKQTRKNIDQFNISNAIEVSESTTLIADFSENLKSQFIIFAKFSKENLFTATAPLEGLVTVVIEAYLQNRLKFTGQHLQAWEKLNSESERLHFVTRFVSTYLTDLQVINLVRTLNPQLLETILPKFENIKASVVIENADKAFRRAVEIYGSTNYGVSDRSSKIVQGKDFIANLILNNKDYNEASIVMRISQLPDFLEIAEIKESRQDWLKKDHSSKVDDVAFYLTKTIESWMYHAEKLRDQSLYQELHSLGAPYYPSQNGYQLLNFLSGQNLVRTKNLYKFVPTGIYSRDSNEIDAIVDSVEYQPVHFSKVGHKSNSFPVLSSSLLMGLGFEPGHNTRQEYSREFMVSHRNVFHFPAIPNLERATRYGGAYYKLDIEFARKWAWLTPGTMDPKHLRGFGVANNVAEPKEDNSYDDLLPAKKQLHRFAFNYTDFETITRIALKHYLNRLSSEDQVKYSEVLEDLRHGRNISHIVSAAHQPMGVTMSSGIELKVPVLIEAKFIETKSLSEVEK